MDTQAKVNAILHLIQSETSQEGWSYERLGEKIEVILKLSPVKKRRVRDKNSPKKTKTAYTFFCQMQRPEVVAEMKKQSGEESVKSTHVVRTLADSWKELKYQCESGNTEAIAEMDEYKVLSEKDKERYRLEFAAYKNSVNASIE